MELKKLCQGCLVLTIAFLFAACNNHPAAKPETTNQEINMDQPSDSIAMKKMDSTAAKMDNEKEENGKNKKEEKEDD